MQTAGHFSSLTPAPPGRNTNEHRLQMGGKEENERQKKKPRRLPFNEMASGLKKKKKKG